MASTPGEPAVSIIVLGYNGQAYVHDCLTALQDQDYDQPYEVIFVDNASSDQTAELAEAFDGVSVHRLAHNYGYTGGNNLGAEFARGRLLVFLNQDAVVHRAWLRELVAAVESDASIAAAHANVIHPWNPEFAAKDRTGRLAVAYSPELSRLGFIQYEKVSVESPVSDTLFLSGVSIILRREVIQDIGGYIFDPDMFLYGEDMDLGLRIRGAGYRTVVATRAALYHSHNLADQISLKSFLKTVRIIRNRLLALWKSSDGLEFLVLASITLAGAPFNSSQFGLPLRKKVLYFILLVPPTIIAAFATLAVMPKYAERRRWLLATRRRPRWWLVRALLFDRKSLRLGRRSLQHA